MIEHTPLNRTEPLVFDGAGGFVAAAKPCPNVLSAESVEQEAQSIPYEIRSPEGEVWTIDRDELHNLLRWHFIKKALPEDGHQPKVDYVPLGCGH